MLIITLIMNTAKINRKIKRNLNGKITKVFKNRMKRIVSKLKFINALHFPHWIFFLIAIIIVNFTILLKKETFN